MKKLTNLIIILITFILLVGCNQPNDDNPVDNGIKPTHDFTVCNYLKDNAVFLQNKEFVISGVSENGVLLKIDIYDQNGSLINTASDIADNNGEFSVKIVAPNGSYNKYKIVITDSVHTHEYNNILFGEVWMFAGEQLNEVVPASNEYNEYVRIFNYNNNEYSWTNFDNNSQAYAIAYKFAEELINKINVPVAIIDSTLPFGNADAWISHFTASNQLKINNYLQGINRYIPSVDNVVLKTNTLSSMNKTYLSELNGLSIRGMIWQQGVTDFNVNSNSDIYKLMNNYTYLTSNIFLDYINYFKGEIDIYSIQNGFVNLEFANELRSAQEQATYLVNNVQIIPTYDCHVLEENLISADVNYVFSPNKFVNRIAQNVLEYTYQKQRETKYSMFTNAVINYNTITLTFSNDIKLNKVDEIYGLNVKTSDGILLNYQFEIEENQIIIELNDLIFNEDMELVISYAENYDLYKCNLYNVYDYPVLPFRIEISD